LCLARVLVLDPDHPYLLVALQGRDAVTDCCAGKCSVGRGEVQIQIAVRIRIDSDGHYIRYAAALKIVRALQIERCVIPFVIARTEGVGGKLIAAWKKRNFAGKVARFEVTPPDADQTAIAKKTQIADTGMVGIQDCELQSHAADFDRKIGKLSWLDHPD